MKTYIVGKNASLSARSPKIFRYLASKLNIPLEMYPKDISNKSSFITKLRELSNQDDFHGLLITNPWKKLWSCYEENHPSIRVKSSGVSNLFWIDKRQRNRFENTDLIALRLILKRFNTENVVIIGTGAMYKTIKLVLNKKVKVITSQYDSTIKNKSRIFRDDESKVIEIFKKSTLVINATPCGSLGFPEMPIESSLIAFLPQNCTVLDLVHTHSNLIFKESCSYNSIKYVNGIPMNNIQAVINFKIICSNYINKSYSYLYSLISKKLIT